MVHAPVFAGDPRTTLAGVWARRPDAAATLAARHGTVAHPTLDALYAACDAVAFSVPPNVQADLAVGAARAGRTLLLEKPVALDVDGARRLADAVGEAGVGSQLVLTWRYADAVRTFLAEAAGRPLLGGRGGFLQGAFLGGPFATPWRLQHGPLLDLGPHVIDTLDAALGPVVGVRAHGGRRWVGLLLEHDTGAVSEVSLSGDTATDPTVAGVEVFDESGRLAVDAAAAVGPAAFTTLVGELVRTAGGEPHPLDVHRGVHLQRVLAEAQADLDRRG